MPDDKINYFNRKQTRDLQLLTDPFVFQPEGLG
jgi:hypothetical protein